MNNDNMYSTGQMKRNRRSHPHREKVFSLALIAMLGLSGQVQAQDDAVSTTVLPDMPMENAADGAGYAPDAVPPVGDGPAGGQPGGPAEIGLIEAPEGDAAYEASRIAEDPVLQNQFFGSSVMESPAPLDSPAIARFVATTPGPLIHPPVVVEMFTSQGCSSCPPADEMIGDLSDRPDVLALSWHVDYWDYLGWTDEFARPEFTRRQKDYARNAGERSIYTPQILVGGTDTLIDIRPADLVAMIEAQMARPVAVSVTSTDTRDGFQIELTPRARLRNSTAVLLVRYAPERTVEIRAGENRGMSVTYRNIVLGAERIADWDGRAPLRLNVRIPEEAAAKPAEPTRHAIIAQQLGRKGLVTGAILAAVKLD